MYRLLYCAQLGPVKPQCVSEAVGASCGPPTQLKLISEVSACWVRSTMALMKAFTAGIRALAPYSSSKLLGNASRAIATSSWTGNSAAQAAQDENEPETTGWGQTRVGDILKAKKDDSGAWLWCSRDDWVIDAIRKMTHANVGSLVVFDASKVTVDRAASKVINATQDAVVGIFTERDYMTKIIVKGKNSSSTKVSEVMTPAEKLVTVTPKHSVLDVMSLMVEKNLRHVPVVDAGALAGMVSIKDVVQVMLKEHREEVGRLQEYISGTF